MCSNAPLSMSAVRAGDRLCLPELLAAERRQVERQHIALHDLEVVKLRHGLRQNGQQRTVKLDRNHVLRAAAQLRRQTAHARADLHDVPRLARAAHLRDALGHRDVGQKVLAERLGKVEPVPSQNRTDGFNIT